MTFGADVCADPDNFRVENPECMCHNPDNFEPLGDCAGVRTILAGEPKLIRSGVPRKFHFITILRGFLLCLCGIRTIPAV